MFSTLFRMITTSVFCQMPIVNLCRIKQERAYMKIRRMTFHSSFRFKASFGMKLYSATRWLFTIGNSARGRNELPLLFVVRKYLS